MSSVHHTPRHMGGRAGPKSVPPHGAVLGAVCWSWDTEGRAEPSSDMDRNGVSGNNGFARENSEPLPTPSIPPPQRPVPPCLFPFQTQGLVGPLPIQPGSMWAEETNRVQMQEDDLSTRIFENLAQVSLSLVSELVPQCCQNFFFPSLFFDVQSCNSDTWFLMWKHPALQTGSVFDVSPFKCSRRASQKCGICKPPSWLFLSVQLSAAVVLSTCKGKEGAQPPCCWVIKIMANPTHYPEPSPLMWLLNMHQSPNKCKSVWEWLLSCSSGASLIYTLFN